MRLQARRSPRVVTLIIVAVAVAVSVLVRFDQPVMALFRDASTHIPAWLADSFRRGGEPIAVFGAGLLMLVLHRRGRSVLARLLAATALAWLVMQCGKSFIVRARPLTFETLSALDWTASWRGFTSEVFRDDALRSFPSGHTANAMAAATVFAAFLPRAAAIFLALAIGCGLSRIVQNQHWPSDVLCGGLIGFVSGRLATTVRRREAD
jgi:membrane-associated phospholipid phosphatase